MSFRGTNATYYESNISCTDDCYLYGNVMSLIDAFAFPVVKKLTKDQTFLDLFKDNEHIDIDAARPFLLPATTLRSDCYFSMFSGCENLTVAPALPATKLAEYCYKDMFRGCRSLEHGPLLPATSLMPSCYDFMFSNCTSLKSVICLATEEIDRFDFTMLYGAGYKSSEEKPTFYKAPGATWPQDDNDDGDNGIPKFWHVENYSVTP